MPKNRMPRGLVALSASAVAVIYTAGYLRTQGADSAISSALLVPTSVPTAIGVPSLKDGTYNGQGTSRRGDVWVSVQVQGGRIANVSITRSTLQYPLRDIAGLPSEVVQRQSAQVDIVSRATYSSMAFQGAVLQALASARA